MESIHLKLAAAAKPSASERKLPAVAAAVGLAGLAALATALAADVARAPRTTTGEAGEIVRVAIEKGQEDPAVRDATRELRAELGARPLDARTRALYAGVLADLAVDAEGLSAAAFHARRAAAQAPVTVPVVRMAALVLVRCGSVDEALALAATMFSYDPPAAARLIGVLEPFLPPGAVRAGVPGEPTAYRAWIDSLRRAGRAAAADTLLAEAQSRWPSDRAILEAFGARAVARRDWDALGAALAAGPALRDDPADAVLFAFRSRLAAARGDAEHARGDAKTALRLAGDRVGAVMAAGDAADAAGDPETARGAYRRGLHSIRSGTKPELRVELLARLARMEERQGRLGDALRAWRELLLIDRGHREANRAVERLTAGS